jgi:hypothetical protein
LAGIVDFFGSGIGPYRAFFDDIGHEKSRHAAGFYLLN